MSILRVIFQQELQQQLRNRVLQFLFPVVMLLTLLLAASHWYHQKVFTENQQYWQNQNDHAWLTQPERHPHRAAHYGNLVYRPPAALTFIDSGVEPYVGNALFLEAHRQNSANFRQFSHSQSYMQLGYLSAATIILVLWPLVLIALGYSALSRENESDTLKQLISLGVKPGQLLMGKGLVFVFFSLIFLLWVFGIASAFVFFGSAGTETDVWSRLLGLFTLYFGYCLMWVVLLMLASYWLKRSNQTLAWSMIAWVLIVVILPKIAALVADSQHPLPARSVQEVEASIAIAKVGDSHNPDDPYFRDFKQSTLKKYGVEKVEDLPVNWRGLVMAEGEKISSEVFQKQYQDLIHKMDAQRQLAETVGVLSPYLLVSQLSKRLAGTDASMFYAFEKQAEAYRYDLIQHLNHLHKHEIKLKNDRGQKLDKHHWKAFDLFKFVPIELQQSLSGSGFLLLFFCIWISGSLALIGVSWNRVVVA